MFSVKYRINLVAILCIIFLSECKKWNDVGAPPTSINEENVYSGDATAISVLTGMYTKMSLGTNEFVTGKTAIWLYSGLSADEFKLYSGVSDYKLIDFYKNDLKAQAVNPSGSDQWVNLYNYIYTCNAALEGLYKSVTLTDSVKNQLLGEAKFIRSFCYFYLVNMFGDVPIALTTDYKINGLLPRSSKEQVYLQIISDLKDAQELLNSDFLNGAIQKYTGVPERVRPSKWAATALLARAYLYIGDWGNAENEATKVLSNSALFGLSDLNNSFLKASLGNKEAIWQLQPVRTGWNTEDARVEIIPTTGFSGNTYPIYLSPDLLASFESGDKRVINGNWVKAITLSGTTYYYPNKYKSAKLNDPVTEYLSILRLSELFLIRAEARAQQNKISDAQSDLNTIRNRAGLLSKTATDKNSLLTDILHERRVELFSEWGHRWFDLKRTNSIDSVMKNATPSKANGAPWQSYQQWYPLPLSDLNGNPNLFQNEKY